MKGFVVGLIILGGIALVGGAAIFAYSVSKGGINDEFVTNEYKLDEDIDNIEVKVSTANVEFKKASDGQAKVVCVEKEKVYHKVDVTNKLLNIEEQDDRKWYQKYLFNWNFKSMSVTVYLPEETYNDITVDANTGSITVNKEFTFANMDLSSDTGSVKVNNKATGNIEINVHTGSVKLNDVNAKSVKVKSSTGDLTYTNGEVIEGIDLQSSTGDINLTSVKANSYNSKTSTGHVSLIDTVIDTKLEVKTSTGGVKFERSDAKDIKVETSTGSVRGTLLTTKIFSAESDTGSIKLPDLDKWDKDGGTCQIKTDTGSINIQLVA